MNALAALDNLSLAGNTKERSRQRRYCQREQPRESRLPCGPWHESEFHVASFMDRRLQPLYFRGGSLVPLAWFWSSGSRRLSLLLSCEVPFWNVSSEPRFFWLRPPALAFVVVGLQNRDCECNGYANNRYFGYDRGP